MAERHDSTEHVAVEKWVLCPPLVCLVKLTDIDQLPVQHLIEFALNRHVDVNIE